MKVGDVILVGERKDRRVVMRAIYRRRIAPPYFAMTVEPGSESWRLTTLPPESAGEDAV